MYQQTDFICGHIIKLYSHQTKIPIDKLKASTFRLNIPKTLTVTYLRDLFSQFNYPQINSRNHKNQKDLQTKVSDANQIQEVNNQLQFSSIQNQDPTPNSDPDDHQQLDSLIIDIDSDSEQYTLNATQMDRSIDQTHLLPEVGQIYGSDSEYMSEISDRSVDSTIQNVEISERRLIALQKHDLLMSELQNADFVTDEDIENINDLALTILKSRRFKSDNPQHNSKGSVKRLKSQIEIFLKRIAQIK
ncbi:Hypothetical_protein [Hexamita inflata]|uniref:Hypothetical_protein n=1 Tax=Hexamita inflata TaxID=28002 RepID=A0AA86V810_9EUKA|nr:Hypothetical protein HINF_LOCUS46488 [Hexamita inflata]CAI9962708.1 Hypothetical protein HINF_LOCUS50353 [Hexamita inflata]